MLVFTIFCLCITFFFILTLGGVNVNVYFIIVEPNIAHNLGLLGILGFTMSLSHGGINPVTHTYSNRSAAYEFMIFQRNILSW